MSFRALLLDRDERGLNAAVQTLDDDDLPDGDTRVAVHYSSLNYKDALAVTGEGQIIRGDFPIVPGIDLVGEVEATESEDFEAGDLVIGTGWQLGEAVWGGFTERTRVAARKLVRLPNGLTPRQAMAIGTAGLTAMLAVMALEDHGLTPTDGEVVVTGASGGAGSMATALLGALGHHVVASTGSEDAHDYLRTLGAERIVGRDAFDQGPERPMDSGKWAGAVDAVGGKTLATVLSQLQRHASAAVFGNAGGHELHTTVLPFILRGVNLLGIDSNTCPNDQRRRAWARLAHTLSDEVLDRMTARTVGLEDIEAASRTLLEDGVQGRIVVDTRA
jgi:acrylyl-CoA reductase (NADPH)